MGPYCKFCGNRCFAYVPSNTPDHIQRAYMPFSIVATCREGQEFEKKKIGFCWDDIQESIKCDFIHKEMEKEALEGEVGK